jgi:hypothetical protein
MDRELIDALFDLSDKVELVSEKKSSVPNGSIDRVRQILSRYDRVSGAVKPNKTATTIEEIHAVLNEQDNGGICEISLRDTVLLCSNTEPRIALLRNASERSPYCVVHVIPNFEERRSLDQNNYYTTISEALWSYMRKLQRVVESTAELNPAGSLS